MFIKIFTRDYNDTLKGIEKFPFDSFEISTSKEHLFNDLANTELMKIIFPEFLPRFTGEAHYEASGDGRHVSKILRDLLSYMRILTNYDLDCQETLNDLFTSYYSTFRKMIQNKILENIFSQIHRMQNKELQRIMAINITFALQMSFFELIYHNYFFNNNIVLDESTMIVEILVKIMDNYYDYIFGFIQMEHNIKNIFEAIDALNYYIDPASLDTPTDKEDSEEDHPPIDPI